MCSTVIGGSFRSLVAIYASSEESDRDEDVLSGSFVGDVSGLALGLRQPSENALPFEAASASDGGSEESGADDGFEGFDLRPLFRVIRARHRLTAP
jgi:hypothetical protein